MSTDKNKPTNPAETERLIDAALDAPPTVSSSAAPPTRRFGAAALVAIGILSSRVVGIVRDMLRAQFFGASNGLVGDAWSNAIRIPNLLQNLLGEGVLSASFIPVYARLLADGDEEEAGRLAGAVGAILGLVVAILVAVGVAFAPLIVQLITSKSSGDQYDLTVRLVRILFPGAALFVFGAWCIGILNSHRRFLLPYIAPVFWNLTMVGAFLWFGGHDHLAPIPLVRIVAWASVAGAGLQVLVQLPSVFRLTKQLRLRFDHRRASVRRVLSNFGPVALSRGVVQISQFVDLWIANLLPNGSVVLLSTAQTVNMLPISLFGMAVSASELPEMSSVSGDAAEQAAKLRQRMTASVARIAYFVVPSAVAFILFGDVIIRVLYERGRWLPIDTVYAWAVLAGSAFGLLASTLGRLYSAAFYAMHDTRRPLRYAIIRVTLTVVLGYLAAIPLSNALFTDRHWGAAGLTLTAGMAGWLEFAMLRAELRRRVGDVSLDRKLVVRLWAIAAAAAVLGYAVQLLVEPRVIGFRPTYRSVLTAAAVLGTYGIAYLGGTLVAGIPEAIAFRRRLFRR